MDDDRSRIRITNGAAVGLTAVTAITVLTIALRSPGDLPDVLTGPAAPFTSLLAMLKELRP
jgi:hypothetical protein